MKNLHNHSKVSNSNMEVGFPEKAEEKGGGTREVRGRRLTKLNRKYRSISPVNRDT